MSSDLLFMLSLGVHAFQLNGHMLILPGLPNAMRYPAYFRCTHHCIASDIAEYHALVHMIYHHPARACHNNSV